MVKCGVKFLLFLLVVTGAFFLFLGIGDAANCWLYTSSANCVGDSSCKWRNDTWSLSGWCEELNCWSLSSNSECTTTVVPGKNCTWQGGKTTYGCEKLNCWSLSGTSANSCENNSLSLNCQWSDYCYTTYGSANCWNLNNQSACLNLTGCAWGQCMERGCWSYSTNTTCAVAKDWNGKNCTWDTSGSYCTENGCWKSQYSTNASACESSAAVGLNCKWQWDSCQTIDCWTWDGNQTGCNAANATYGLSCSWSGSWCNKQDCWGYTTQGACQGKASCVWKTYLSSGYCQEVNCWTWDSYNSGNQSLCENNDGLYGLDCIWSGNPTGNKTNGWCYKDVSSVSCSNKTTERACMDTYYCWWQFNDWNNVSKGGNCSAPGAFGGGGGGINTTIMNDWNPGCYIFDMNSSDCNNVFGCSFNTTISECNELTDAYGGNISLNGLNCSFINDSRLCNNIPMLSACCAWQSGSCVENKLSTACRDQMEAPPAGASFCEDYNSYENEALCKQIGGSPWYMPCKWDNATVKCKFKADDVFTNNESQSLTKLNNKKSCEAGGGKWIIDNYCEGNISVPAGRCEYKFNEEDNCDRACYACEIKDSDGISVNSTNANSSCIGSGLGICEYKPDTNAPNGIGYCAAKEQYKKGILKDCDTNCGDCTYKGNAGDTDTSKRPSYYCITSKANSAGGGCKWVVDNSTATGGYCIKKGEKTCEDACDRCKTQTNCQNLGRTTVSNQTGGCKWSGDSTSGSCVTNIGEEGEVCWDGIDNNDNNLIDCADTSCYADSYCGIVSGDCFVWSNSTTCTSAGCEWVTDNWGSWCDFTGSQCWKYTVNSTSCGSHSNCKWTNGTGASFCEQDYSKQETCMGLGQTACMLLNNVGCNWTIDSWCSGTGNGTEWCRTGGGWCDNENFKPKNCWQYSSSGSTACTNTNGCTWKSDTYSIPHCEVNWSANCWQYSTNATCAAISTCAWINDTWGAWCTNKMDTCWRYSQGDCTSALGGGKCYWETWGSGSGGNCNSLCYNQSSTSTSCSAVTGCIWKAENGWCEDNAMASCSNSTNMNTATNCRATIGCRWKDSGWCDPINGAFSTGAGAGGGGVGTAMGGDCYKYDGNQSLCTNKTIINISCGWFPEANPKCDVNWGANCWQYTTAEGGCNATKGCWFNNNTWGSYCTNIMDQCWQNTTYQSWNNSAGWEGNCSANPYCINNSWGSCEPRCSSFNITTCNVSLGCRYITGWCNPGGMNAMFDSMQAGAPAPLGADTCGEIAQASVDICGFGMRDMEDSYGFGAMMDNFENASICNKEEISSFVMGMSITHEIQRQGIQSSGTSFGTKRTGSGNDIIIYLVYLDTDGATTGGCALGHNSSAVGYEFRFKYTSEWNANTSKAVEKFNADQCEDSSWKATDIKLSVWKKSMCSEIGGPMIAVQKADLARFPTLYDSTKDMRVYVVSIGNSGNVSSPSDSAGPGWTTPGSVDFEIMNAFAYGADTSKFGDILKKGFVVGEDCFNGFDDDGDDSVDCNDWECQYSSNCTSKGVNAASYSDTTSPLVTGVKIEEYPDAALVVYDTNKPTNGTLEWYADSRCLNKTNEIYDIGILLSNNVRTYKTWHVAQIYETSDSIGGRAVSLSTALSPNTNYYYKIKVCDSVGRCSLSKCTSIKTPSSVQKCGYCDFVTRIKVPTGWNISYDVGRDGTYEHVQGQVCGPNAGMKTNYTIGRKVHVKLTKADGSVYFEFLNASLTKTGLNDKVRTISSAGDIIADSNKMGLTSETRDKIINNLHPEVCRVKIPFSGTCDTLYHCDDSGANCVDKTSTSVLINATNCVWEIPYCEFSTYRESTSSPGGGSSSGGGGSTNKPVVPVSPVKKTSAAETGVAEEGAEPQLSPPGEAIKKAAEGILWAVLAIAVLAAIVGIYMAITLKKKHEEKKFKKSVKLKPGRFFSVR